MKFLIPLVAVMAMISGPASTSGITAETIEYEYNGVTLQGYLAYDASQTGMRPGVIVVHEWWGLNDYPKMRARQLAELGYVAFAVDMYGNGATATTADDAGAMAGKVMGDTQLERGRINAALDLFKQRGDVDPDKIAAIGYCFGGGVVLELARSGADLAGVVSFHGVFSTNAPAGKGDIKAKILVLSGTDDKSASVEQVGLLEDEMRNAGADYQINLYGNAVHAFSNPAAGNDPSTGVAYNAEADRRSWKAMLDFFDEIFGI